MGIKVGPFGEGYLLLFTTFDEGLSIIDEFDEARVVIPCFEVAAEFQKFF